MENQHPSGFSSPYPDDPKNKQKKYMSLLRFSNYFGLALIIGNIATFALSYLLNLILALAEISRTGWSEYYNIISQIVFSIILYVPTFAIAGHLLGSGSIKLKVSDKSFSAELIMFGLGGTIACNIITNIFVEIFNSFGATPQSFDMDIPRSPAGIVLYLFAISIVPAAVEEFAIRGIVLGTLRQIGDKTAVIISAALFALIHGNFVQIPFAFLMGLMMGYITVASNSLIPAVIIHFTNNMLSGVQNVMYEFCDVNAAVVFSSVKTAVLLILGVIGLILLLTTREKPFGRCLKSDFPSHPAKNTAVFFISPAMIANVILYGGLAIYDLFK